MVKIAHFLRAGCKVKILLADIHAFLDNIKAPMDLVEHRAKYYEFVITSLLRSISVPIDKLEFVLGSTYQESQKYTRDRFRLSTIVSQHDAVKAGAEGRSFRSSFQSCSNCSLLYDSALARERKY